MIIPLLLGWTSGVTNPMTTQVAQIIAELPIGSGFGLRFLLYVVLAALGFYFLIRYGERVKKSAALSLMEDDGFELSEFGVNNIYR